jgi:hypothetical protein
LVEQRIENPRVLGSIPRLATNIPAGFRESTLELFEIRVQLIAHKPPGFPKIAPKDGVRIPSGRCSRALAA